MKKSSKIKQTLLPITLFFFSHRSFPQLTYRRTALVSSSSRHNQCHLILVDSRDQNKLETNPMISKTGINNIIRTSISCTQEQGLTMYTLKLNNWPTVLASGRLTNDPDTWWPIKVRWRRCHAVHQFNISMETQFVNTDKSQGF